MYNIKQLAPVVNQPEVWEPLNEYILELEKETISQFKAATTTEQLWQMQGQLRLLDSFKRMRDRVIAAKGEH